MINSKVIQTLKPLGVTAYWQEYEGDSKEYIIFSTTSQNNTFHNDDDSEVEVIDVSLVFWFRDAKSSSKIKDLKSLMKNNRFIKMSEKDIQDGEYFGRSYHYRYFNGL